MKISKKAQESQNGVFSLPKKYLYTVRIMPERKEVQCKGNDIREIAEKLKVKLDRVIYVHKEKVR